MTNIFEFKFKTSRSNNFKDAIKLAKKFDHFVDYDDKTFELKIGKVELYEKWDYFAPLHHYITKWAGTQVWFEGKLIAPYKNDKFYAVQGVHYCIKSYNDSLDNERFCGQDNNDFIGWGCKKISSIIKNISYYYTNYWYNYGKFIEKSIWEIDKNKIKIILQNESIKKCLHTCPNFKIDIINKSVDTLPDSIDLSKDKNWEIVYTKNFLGSSIVKIPVGIRHIDDEDYSLFNKNTNKAINEVDISELLRDGNVDKLSDDQINKIIDIFNKKKNK